MTLLQERQRRLAITSASGLVLLAVVIILVNVIANWFFLRFDLTQRHAYSLSSASRKLVRQIDDRVIVKAYFTPDLPSPYNTYARYARDLLTEYRAASNGHLKFEFVLTSPTKDFEQRASEAGLMPIQFQQSSSDQFQVRRGFMGLVMFYGDKSETIPVIRSIEGLEYDITTKLARMTRKAKKVVGYTAGHGELEWRIPQSRLAQDLQELYELKPIALPLSTTAPIQADALLVTGPTQKLDDKSLWALDQAVMQGIPTAFLVDVKQINPRAFVTQPMDSGLTSLLSHYGISVGDRLVYDAQCQTVMMTQNVGGFALQSSLPYPYMLAITGFANDHAMTRDLDSVGVAFSVTLGSGTASGITRTSILQTTARSWLAPIGNSRVSPDAIPQPAASDPHGPYTIGALYEGSFTSYFQGKPAPVAGQALIGASPKTQLFVLGTAQLLNPDLPVFPGTDGFMTNLIAFLSHDETLLGIHPKGDLLRPLKPVPSGAKEAIQVLCVLGVAFLAAVLGVIRWRRRQSWRQTVTEQFGAASQSSQPQ